MKSNSPSILGFSLLVFFLITITFDKMTTVGIKFLQGGALTMAGAGIGYGLYYIIKDAIRDASKN